MEILPLFTHKHVKVYKNTNSYTIQCLQNDIRPGVYAVVNVLPRTWYYVETICSKQGGGRPGIWIGTPIKRTLFYGEKVMDTRKTYIRKSFFTSNFNKLLVGMLIENSSPNSSCTIEKFIVKKKQVEDEDYYKTNDDIIIDKNIKEFEEFEKFEDFKDFESYNKFMLENDIPVDIDYSTILDINYKHNINFDIPDIEYEKVIDPIYTISKKYKFLTITKNIYPIDNTYPIQLGIPLERLQEIDTIQKINKTFSIKYKKDIHPLDCIKALANGWYIKNIPTELFPFVYNELEYTSLTKDIKYKIQDLVIYNKEYVSTIALAKYIEHFIKKKGKEILVLTSDEKEVYEIQLSILHGFKSYLSNSNVIDYPRCLELYNNNNNFYHIEETHVNRSRIIKRIELHHFTYIIIIGNKEKSMYQEQINKYYYDNEIVYIGTNIKNTKRKGLYFTNKIL